MQADPDAELMLGFQAGDQIAFRRLFDRHKGRVVNYCYRFCGQPALAEELAQETFLRVYKAAHRYRPRARFKTWLFKIATNVCLNEMRRSHYRNRFETLEEFHESENSHPETEGTPAADRPDERLEQAERQQMILRAIAQLPAEQRAALLLRVEQDFSYQQIGRQLGRSENHVKTLIYRGRQKLKKALAAYLGNRS
jgi:RNA polymerase sigma-70 factor, ECF subfamily